MTPIVVYSKPACVQCTAAINRLARAEALFEVEPITDQVAEAAKALGVMSAPIVTLGEHTIGGYNPDAIDDMIQAQKAMVA